MSISNPEYFSMTFDMEGFDNEIWMAMLSDWPFEAFHEDGNTIIAYILKHDITQDLLESVNEAKGIRFREYEMDVVPDQNWNAVWESSFNPVAVDDYCYIRAGFHAGSTEGFKHEVIIAPKMAFGTGHHATTYMMLQAMSKLDFQASAYLISAVEQAFCQWWLLWKVLPKLSASIHSRKQRKIVSSMPYSIT